MELQKKKAGISFKEYKINSVKFIADENINESIRELEVQLEVIPNILGEREFTVNLTLKVNDETNKLMIELNAIAYFLSEDIIDESFKESHYVQINAPAIVFPYLRAYISNLTIGAGFNPIVLPTLNFNSKD